MNADPKFKATARARMQRVNADPELIAWRNAGRSTTCGVTFSYGWNRPALKWDCWVGIQHLDDDSGDHHQRQHLRRQRHINSSPRLRITTPTFPQPAHAWRPR